MLQLMILQDADGRLASNQSISWKTNHLLMSNLEPRHTYYVKVAAYNSQGVGPFSSLLTVRPEPSLAMGAMSASGDGKAETKGWVVPFVICFVLTLGVLATLALFFVKYRATRGGLASPPFWKKPNDRFYSFTNAMSQSVTSIKHRRKPEQEGMEKLQICNLQIYSVFTCKFVSLFCCLKCF